VDGCVVRFVVDGGFWCMDVCVDVNIPWLPALLQCRHIVVDILL